MMTAAVGVPVFVLRDKVCMRPAGKARQSLGCRTLQSTEWKRKPSWPSWPFVAVSEIDVAQSQIRDRTTVESLQVCRLQITQHGMWLWCQPHVCRELELSGPISDT